VLLELHIGSRDGQRGRNREGWRGRVKDGVFFGSHGSIVVPILVL
jgi:hypothetical protein